MKILFAHDHKFYKYNNLFYTKGGFDSEVLSRYTNVFKEVNFISRQMNVTKLKEGFSLASMDGLTFIKVPNFNTFYYIFKLHSIKKIVSQAVKNCDAVIARLPSLVGSLSIKYAKKHNKPYLIEVVGCAWDAFWYHSLKGKIVAPLMYYNMKKLVKESKFTIYVTEKYLQKRYPSKGISTNCSNVQLNNFSNQDYEKRIEKIKAHKFKEIIIGTAGAVDVKYKGQQYVIKALATLKARGIDNYLYHIVGGGNPKRLIKYAKKYNVVDKIVFHGLLKHNQVLEWMETIDIYIQPSITEGLPRSLIEAMSKAVPAIGSNVGGIPELLHTNFLIKKANSADICKVLEKFNRDIMSSEAMNNYEVAKKYSNIIINKRRSTFLENFSSSL